MIRPDPESHRLFSKGHLFRKMGAHPYFGKRRSFFQIFTLFLGLLVNTAHADEKSALKLLNSTNIIRLIGADCLLSRCWLSGVFAPSVVRDNVAVIPIINDGPQLLTITPEFMPTNGPAVALGDTSLLSMPQRIELQPGQTVALQLKLPNRGLRAGLYTG
ncbi:hypothetical protein [Methylobacterium nodulans]|uniref:hypothetical protein n=1 Tax=Methylobacterium nodulans TaxID=114616 RepID=UPI0012EDD3B1|nr:hypothetical protein [Methylobacterium nodulans]